MSGWLHAPAALLQGKEPSAPIGKEVGGPRTGLDDVEKILDPTGTRTPTPLSSSPMPVAIPGSTVYCTEPDCGITNAGNNPARIFTNTN
jgi:hypothetical protein